MRFDSTPLGPAKGFPPWSAAMTRADVGSSGWRIDTDLSTPLAVIDQSALDHNIRLMASYCHAEGVLLAPHGKTTMSPELIDRQLRAGAWGMTAATVAQARTMVEAGARRVIVANVCVDPVSIRWIGDLLDDCPDLELSVFADSVRAVEILRRYLHRAGSAGRSLGVVVEVGAVGGRAGARDLPSAVAVAEAIQHSPELELRGVGGFEGVLGSDRSGPALDRVRLFLGTIRDTAAALIASGLHDPDRPFLVTAGGTAYFDLVVEVLSPRRFDHRHPTDLVLRSGCYLLHDHGVYQRCSPFAGSAGGDFLPALTVWSTVLSVPEPELAVIDAGKRDIAVEGPVPVLQGRRGVNAIPVLPTVVERFNDQHGYISMTPGALEVGDRVQLGTSHPCLTLDKWRLLPVVDGEGSVLSVIGTEF